MQVHINERRFDPICLRSLNLCFAGWGDERSFAWAFDRAMGNAPKADTLVLAQDGEIIAGSGVSYRRLLLPSGQETLVGIMSGSWTLPAARGRGCFARIIEESMRLTARQAGSLLLAFVTESNASCRQLLRSGAMAIPSVYAVHEPAAEPQAGTHDLVEGNVTERQFEQWATASTRSFRFAYDWPGFRGQFLQRPGTVKVLTHSDGSFAVVHDRPDTDHILAFFSPSGPAFLLQQLVNYSHGRKVFVFSMEETTINVLQRLGFSIRPGFLTANVIEESMFPLALPMSSRGEWRIQSGDRM